MKDADWNKIKEKLCEIQKDLVPNELVSKLYQHGALTDNDQDSINCEKTRLDKVNKLLEILRTAELQHEDIYTVFYSLLGETHGHLARRLRPPGKARKHPSAASESTKGRNLDAIHNWDVEQVCQFLEPIFHKLKLNDSDKVLQTFRDEEISGRVFLHITEADLKEICPELKFGHRKQVILEREEFIHQSLADEGNIEVSSNESISGLQKRDYPRTFDTNIAYTEKYTKGKRLENLQMTVGRLVDPIHLCIALGDNHVDSALETIGWETVKFTAACMNERTNGTLHFGIYDGTDGIHDRGIIEGISTLEQTDCEESIRSWVEKCFPPETQNTVKSCLRPPKFVDVISKREIVGFVLEVDVNPKANLVLNEAYYIKDVFIKNGKGESEKQLHRFKDGIPCKQNIDEVFRFMETKSKLTKQREEEEKMSLPKNYESRNLLRKLQDFFCDGDTTMGNVYPILVINGIRGNISLEELHSKFSFISEIDWMCTFDFDPEGLDRGLYNYLHKKQDQEFNIKLTEDFDRRANTQTQEQVTKEKLQEEMRLCNLKQWIFCNGYDKMDKEEMGILEWKRKRSEGFKEAVRYFSLEIPRDRAKIVYLLLSKDYSVMLEAVEEFNLKFQNQWTVIAETDAVAAQWQEQLICRNIVEKGSLESRVITGYNWEDVNTCMKEITGVTSDLNDECSLVTHLGTSSPLPRNNQNKLCDLEILSSTECGKFDTMSEHEQAEIAKDHETKFYQGHPPSWINFYHGFHVLRRKNYDQLLQNVKIVLNGDIPDNVNIGRVTIYHQPGSGGTTTAKQVIWDMRERVRCCILKSYSKESHDQIVDLWKYGENDVKDRLPVLVMVDNLEDEKLQNLIESLQKEANNHFQGAPKVMCVLLICHRQSSLPPDRDRMKFVLKQELHPEERKWFQTKYNDLTESFKKQKGPNPKNLLSLNIMKENFSEKYIENTVAEILQDVTIPEERTLLKYVSLLNTYDHQFRGIPVPCFDSMMASRRRFQDKRWEHNFSSPTNMLMVRSKGHLSGLRIINPLLSKWVLDCLTKNEGQSLSEVMLELLYFIFGSFRYHDMAFQQLFIILREMMKKREITASGKPTTFSRLIQELYDSKNVDAASKILELLFEKTSDPYIAQQLARLYILCENWTKATHYAIESTCLRPQSSYLWDTHGQIFKFRLAKLFHSGISSDLVKNQVLMQEAVEVAYEGTQRFLKVQELSCHEKQMDPNTAGFVGEIDIYLSLLDMLCMIPQLENKSKLRLFINGESPAPQELALLTEKQLHWLMNSQGKIEITLRKFEDETYKYQSDQMNVTYQRSKSLLNRSLQAFGSYFGDDNLSSLAEATTLSPDKRRLQVKRLGVTSLQTILKLSQKENMKQNILTIYRMMQMNADHQQAVPYDCSIALGSALALLPIIHTPSELPNFDRLLQTSAILYNMKRDGNYIDLEPYLYLLLLHWPTRNRKKSSSLISTEVLFDAMSKWKNAYAAKYPKENHSFCIKDRPLFFLTNKVGVESVVHIDQLKKQQERPFGHFQLSKVLGTRQNRQLLERFDGILSGNGWNVTFRLETPNGNKLVVQIPLHTRESRQSLQNKKVYFVLGFGWSGPRACDIQTEEIMPDASGYVTVARRKPKKQRLMTYGQLYNISQEVINIQNQLLHIAHLKTIPRNQLLPVQVQAVRQETLLISRLTTLLKERYSRYLDSL